MDLNYSGLTVLWIANVCDFHFHGCSFQHYTIIWTIETEKGCGIVALCHHRYSKLCIDSNAKMVPLSKLC